MFSPLEQFEIFPIIRVISYNYFNNSPLDFSITNSSIFCFFSLSFIYFIYKIVYKLDIIKYIPTRLHIIFEIIYHFISDIVKENIGTKKAQYFFPFIFALFLFVLFANLIGLVPYSFTTTSHFIIAFSLSIIIWVGKVVYGFYIHKLSFFSVLLPKSIPFPLIPFFVVIELISYMIPLVSLGIRLFANIIAGHILLKVFVGFCWTIIISGGTFIYFAHYILIIILFCLLFLEITVCFIQAYIFTILSSLSIGESIRGNDH